MPNINKVCKECMKPFYFAEKDQLFFSQMGFPEPLRCHSCRKARKKAREEVEKKTEE